MGEALEAVIECFAGRRSAQGDPKRHRFAVLPSPEEPRYLLPLGDSRTTLEGFRVYTPQAFGARLRKGLLTQIVKTGWSGWAMHSLYVGEPLGLKALVSNVTGERNPAFAMILGRPGKYRKLTIQVMRSGGETLGYIKLGLTKPAGERVRHEASMLEALSALRYVYHMYSIPESGKRVTSYFSRRLTASLVLPNCPPCTCSFSTRWRLSGVLTRPDYR